MNNKPIYGVTEEQISLWRAKGKCVLVLSEIYEKSYKASPKIFADIEVSLKSKNLLLEEIIRMRADS